MLNECRQVIMRSENKIDMLHDICHHIVNTGGYSAAWIGLLGKDDKKNIVSIGHVGLGENYNLLIENVWKKIENDRGPTGSAVRENKISVNTSRPGRRYPAWLSEMKSFGYAASVSFPLKVERDLAGVLNVYSNNPQAFKAEDLDVFMELHKDVVFGIKVMRMHLESERFKERLEEMVEERTKELALSEERYKNVVEHIGIGISIISPKMEILSLNKKMREWFPKIDVGQKPICYKAFNEPPRNEICSYCPTCKSLVDGQVHEAVTQTPVKGKIMNYHVISSLLKNSEGNIIGAVKMVEDITEKK